MLVCGVCSADVLTQIKQSLLRKYIAYARKTCKPQLSRIDDDKLGKLYSELRRESQHTGGIPIAVRHIESMVCAHPR